jgi:hypothetical protein
MTKSIHCFASQLLPWPSVFAFAFLSVIPEGNLPCFAFCHSRTESAFALLSVIPEGNLLLLCFLSFPKGIRFCFAFLSVIPEGNLLSPLP